MDGLFGGLFRLADNFPGDFLGGAYWRLDLVELYVRCRYDAR